MKVSKICIFAKKPCQHKIFHPPRFFGAADYGPGFDIVPEAG